VVVNLGWFEVGMNVADIIRSAEFYETLGFEVADGSAERRVRSLHRKDCSITLYQGFGDDPLYLQFWQGDNAALAERVRHEGLTFDRPPGKDKGEGEGDAFLLRDPDSHGLFFVNQADYWTKPFARAQGASAYDPARRQYLPSARDSLAFGRFVISLPVADEALSRAFYEKLGFQRVGETNMVRSNDCVVAFYGLWLERPQLIFWQGDVDAIERELTTRGLNFRPRFNDDKGSGAMLIDPDGNPLYFINQTGLTRPPPRETASEPVSR
jgi:catechol 2,3-dioxygenase-like lactoylglutathione lyase family enzyme